jgi:murein L,D-transpeptidase YcbB/YkuD
MERFVPRKKEDARYLADSLLSKKHKDNKYFEDVHKPYGLLKEQLGKYLKIVTAGGWPQVPATDKKLKPGESTPAIAIMKKRLQITGDMPGGDTSAIFTDTLAMGIRNFQGRHGLKEDGTISQTLIKEMNVPAEARLQQILMNMGRMRWLPPQPTGNLILVNIPEFMLHAYEGAKKAFDMVVVVGKEGHNTTTFTGDLNQVVFSPYWNVPESIVEKEILPAMARNASYLENQNMEIVSQNGSLPTIRQKPGQNNALGKVKFLFPNSFDIYFHDTPSKSLFERSMRAFSHGCIRLAEPEKMANYLLRNQPEWTPERISEAMNKGEEEIVKLKDAVPVVITYYTAWVDDRGRLNFRDDIYGHDKKLAAKMFHSPAPGVSKVKDSAAVALR